MAPNWCPTKIGLLGFGSLFGSLSGVLILRVFPDYFPMLFLIGLCVLFRETEPGQQNIWQPFGNKMVPYGTKHVFEKLNLDNFPAHLLLFFPKRWIWGFWWKKTRIGDELEVLKIWQMILAGFRTAPGQHNLKLGPFDSYDFPAYFLDPKHSKTQPTNLQQSSLFF